MGKRIALVATLDTKGPEPLYLKERIESKGHHVLVIDVSCTSHTSENADISNNEVAKAADSNMSNVSKMVLIIIGYGSRRPIPEMIFHLWRGC
ncbi:MAG: Tm-1-like ATP-binding domain-containing protein [Deltaproteobacteria bacterium]|nr:Tm-1-like ATP-binding domain-containing protein [Deltaproteobacteria bacterium]